MKYYLISDEHVAQVAEDLFGDNLIDHHTYTVFDEVVIGDAPVVQWHPITDQPIPKPANERQVLVLSKNFTDFHHGHPVPPISEDQDFMWDLMLYDCDTRYYACEGYTHYCIIETPLPPTV